MSLISSLIKIPLVIVTVYTEGLVYNKTYCFTANFVRKFRRESALKCHIYTDMTLISPLIKSTA